jgi:hypothetical protein
LFYVNETIRVVMKRSDPYKNAGRTHWCASRVTVKIFQISEDGICFFPFSQTEVTCPRKNWKIPEEFGAWLPGYRCFVWVVCYTNPNHRIMYTGLTRRSTS